MFEDFRDRYLEGIAAMGIEFPMPQVKLDDCPGPVSEAADRLDRALQRYEVMLSTRSAIIKEIERFNEGHQTLRSAQEIEEYSLLSSRLREVTQELLDFIPNYEAAIIELARLQERLRSDT